MNCASSDDGVILAHTSVWVDHPNGTDGRFAALLDRDPVVGHAFVLGEVALGKRRRRTEVLEIFRALPQASMADDDEVLDMIERAGLAGSGIGYVDAHLLAAAKLTYDCRLWTNDKRLDAVAARLNLAARIVH